MVYPRAIDEPSVIISVYKKKPHVSEDPWGNVFISTEPFFGWLGIRQFVAWQCKSQKPNWCHQK